MLQHIADNKDLYPAHAKITSILTTVSEELPDCPFFVDLHGMSGTLKCTPPPATTFRSALVNAGYRCSSSHTNPTGVKTDAPMEVLWDIMRCWVKEHAPVKDQGEETAAYNILAKEPVLVANFARAHAAMSKAKEKGQARFLPNPEENWGPKSRHGRPPAGTLNRKRGAGAAAEGDGEGCKKK
mmetsp:Transcript_32572/g.103769  ORF Transcript_32572/g.103769 Transcript_32572/m.103769 type:complete len:183 (+) Transcript_32572:92-640(+)